MNRRCPVCGCEGGRRHAGRGGLQLVRCRDCGSAYLDATAHPYRPEAIYDQGYFAPWNMQPGSPSWTLRAGTAAARLALLQRLGASGSLLDIGAAGGYLVAEAVRRGFDAQGLELSEHAVAVAEQVVPGRVRSGVLEAAGFAAASFDTVTAFDLVEHHPEPRVLLTHVGRILAAGGLFAATVPDRSSLTARLMRGAWPHYKEEHRFYPTRSGFRRLLEGTGLRLIHEQAARKQLSLAYLVPLLEAYPVPLVTRAAAALARTLPRAVREVPFTFTIGERLYVARKPA